MAYGEALNYQNCNKKPDSNLANGLENTLSDSECIVRSDYQLGRSVHEPTLPHALHRHPVIQRIVQRQKLAQLGRQQGLHLWTQQLLLVLLLWLVAAGIERMDRCAGTV